MAGPRCSLRSKKVWSLLHLANSNLWPPFLSLILSEHDAVSSSVVLILQRQQVGAPGFFNLHVGRNLTSWWHLNGASLQVVSDATVDYLKMTLLNVPAALIACGL